MSQATGSVIRSIPIPNILSRKSLGDSGLEAPVARLEQVQDRS